MTREELNKEAKEFTDSKKSFWRQGRTCIDSVKQAYIAGAEPREKRITELEATNKKISEECHKLVDSLEKKQNEVAELKERNRELLESCEGATMMYEDLCKAKEIIKELLDFDFLPDIEIKKQAEQFLQGVKE